MTNREFFERVIETVEDAEIVEFAKASIVKLDERNAKRKEQTSKKAKENEPIKKSIIDYLKGKELVTCSEIAKAIDISTQKCSALCRQLVDSEVLSVTDVKVKSKGKQKAYTIRWVREMEVSSISFF